MHITIKATSMELTDAIETYVREKVSDLEKILDTSDTSLMANVEVGKTTEHHHSGNIFFAAIDLHMKMKNLRSSVERDDLYAAIDEVKDEMAREIKTHREKHRTLKKKGGAEIKNKLKGIG